MWIAYLDESGCLGSLPTGTSDIQPVFLQAAVCLPQRELARVTTEYLELKRKFFPRLIPTGGRLDAVLAQVKGSRIRSHVRGTRKERRQAIGFLDKTLDLVEGVGGRLVGRVWVKGIGIANDPRALYTFSLQETFCHFQEFLSMSEDRGFLVADSRKKSDNSNATHSIFTKKFGRRGDVYPRIMETPTFGHSENHVGLQLADQLCSSLLFPIACFAYCSGFLQSIHVAPEYEVLRDRYGERLRVLAFTYKRWNERKNRRAVAGGITVSDRLGQRPPGLMFCDAAPVGTSVPG